MEVAIQASHAKPPHHVELILSYLLRTGVVASLSIVVAGMIISFVHHHEYLSVPEALQRVTTNQAEFPHTVHDVITGVSRLSGRAIVLSGLLLLIATPVLRVAVSILVFAYLKDRTFVMITAIVLLLLLASFVLGTAG
jgi:uncharacterized membrane protein